MTKYWKVDPNRVSDRGGELSDAAALLRDGDTVAFPTETVYGLGADATNTSAVERIFSQRTAIG